MPRISDFSSHLKTRPQNPSDFDNVGDIKVDAQGNVYLCGINSTDFLTFKYNADGTLAWNRALDVSYTEGISEIAVDSAGNVIVAGSAEFRHNSGLANDDAVTFKYDANGNHLWTRTYTGIWDGYYVDDGPARVLVDSAGNAYVGIETRDEAGKYVFGLLKYTPDGTESLRIFRGPNAGGTDTLFDMAFDGAGDLYMAGSSYVVGQGANFLVIKVAPEPGLTTPVITWNDPADITYGTALSDMQLNATASVPGTFRYTPSAGTVLGAGTHQLSVTFTPADAVNFNSVTQIVPLTVTVAGHEESAPQLQLLLDESGPEPNQAAALDSLLFLSHPFSVVNAANMLNQGTDRNTRVIVFVTNLQLTQNETASSVIVNLVDGNQQSYEVAADDVRLVPGFNFTQVIFRLPDHLAPGTCGIKVKAHGQETNVGMLRIGS